MPTAPERPKKRIADSLTHATHILRHEDINGENRLFGGRLMEWIDDVAGIAARRHAGCSITTACVDTLVFMNPAYLNDIVALEASVTYVGKTSIEVRVDSYVEDPAEGTRILINHALLTEVCVGHDDKPIPVPYDLELVSEEERVEWENARLRIQLRKARQEGGF